MESEYRKEQEQQLNLEKESLDDSFEVEEYDPQKKDLLITKSQQELDDSFEMLPIETKKLKPAKKKKTPGIKSQIKAKHEALFHLKKKAGVVPSDQAYEVLSYNQRSKRKSAFKDKKSYQNRTEGFENRLLPEAKKGKGTVAEAKWILNTPIEKAFKIKDDDAFTKNLVANYETVARAERLSEELEQIELPKELNKDLILDRIEEYRLVRNWMDAKLSVIRDPFYALLAGKDVKDAKAVLSGLRFQGELTDEQEKLRSYLEKVQALENCAFQRRPYLKKDAEYMKTFRNNVKSARENINLLEEDDEEDLLIDMNDREEKEDEKKEVIKDEDELGEELIINPREKLGEDQKEDHKEEPKEEIPEVKPFLSDEEQKLVYTENLASLSAEELKTLKTTCLSVLTRSSGKSEKDFELLPLDQLITLTQNAAEDYPDEEKLKTNVNQRLQEMKAFLQGDNLVEILSSLWPEEMDLTEEDRSQLKNQELAESARLSMTEYATLALKQNPLIKLTKKDALSDLSPSDLVLLSKNALYLSQADPEGQDEETEAAIRKASVSVLTLSTGLPETKFMMRPAAELQTLVKKALGSLDDREQLRKDTLDFLEKIPDFDVAPELLNDREKEILEKDRGSMSGAEIRKQKSVAERALVKTGGLKKQELDLLPLDFKVSLAKKVLKDHADPEKTKAFVNDEITALLGKEEPLNQMERLSALPAEEEGDAETLRTTRDEFVFALAKTNLAGEATRSDFDHVPLKELKNTAVLALQIAGTVPYELEEADLKEYRATLSHFLKEKGNLPEKELSLLPTSVLTDYAKQLIQSVTSKEEPSLKTQPLDKESLELRISALTGEAFGEKGFEEPSVKEARLELKELIACRICMEKDADRDALMRLPSADLYVFYTEGQWEKEEHVENALEVQLEQSRERTEAYGTSKPLNHALQEWSEEGKQLLSFLSDLTSGLGVTDENGLALAKEERVGALMHKNADLIASLANGNSKAFQELSAGATDEELVLFKGLRKFVDNMISDLKKLKEASDLKKQKEKNEAKKDEKWSKETVEALLDSKEGKELLAGADDQILSVIEEEGKNVQTLISDATKDIFISVEQRDQQKEEDDEIPELLPIDELTDKVVKYNEIKKKKRKEEQEKEAEKETDDLKKLHKMRDNAFSKDSIQGRFLQASLSGYYENSSSESKRLMLSEMLRDLKPKRRYQSGMQHKRKAGYLSSVLKGAGPVMQKLLQGVPEDMVKPEYKKALQLVKSELRHIPEEYVAKKLQSLKETSKKPVKKIEKISSLGAASVAETFLCKVTYEDGSDPEQVVVKILRPDAENRMKEEDKILSGIAKKTDGSSIMHSSIQSHMKEIKKEFDFRTEADNCLKGKKYETASLKNGTVKTVQLNENFPVSKDCYVMNKAEGESCDRYIQRTKESADAGLSVFLGKEMQESELYVLTEDNAPAYLSVRNHLVSELKRAELRKKHLVELSKKWVKEALYGDLFHHGDLHSGNLMISDDGVTVLDYGNANTFTKQQVGCIVRLMAAATSGKSDVFIEDLEELINLGKKPEEKQPIPEDQKKEFQEKLKEVFSLGEAGDAGERIFVALLKAEESGIQLPHEIQNFSRCEQRLENTINEMNGLIKKLKKSISHLDNLDIPDPDGGNLYADPVRLLVHLKANYGTKVGKDPAGKLLSDVQKTDKIKFTEALKKTDSKSREEFEASYMPSILTAYEDLTKDKDRKAALKALPNKIKEWKKRYNETAKIEDQAERSLERISLQDEILGFYSQIGSPETLINVGTLTNLLSLAMHHDEAEALDEIFSYFEDATTIQKLVGEYENVRSKLGYFRRDKHIETFTKDFLAFDERSKQNQLSMRIIKEMFSPFLKIREDQFYVQSYINASPHFPELLKKKENGEYVYGGTAKTLEKAVKDFQALGLKNGDEPTPEQEKVCIAFAKAKCMAFSEFVTERGRRLTNRQLAKYFNDGTAFGSKLKKAHESFRNSQIAFAREKFKNPVNEKALKEAKEKFEEQEKQWISLYRELLTKELTEWKKKEENPPAVDPINFTGVMVEQIMDNRLATVRYLGGFSKIKRYTSKNIELDMTEEELKKLEKQAAG